jgi:hypothetical protein
MLLPAIVACTKDEPDNTDNSSQQSTESSSKKDDESTSQKPNDDKDDESSSKKPDNTGDKDYVYSQEDQSKKWEGKTLTVLATTYSKTGGAPWGQFELNPASFGTDLNTAFEERQAIMQEYYGVTVKWLAASSAQSIAGDLAEAENAENLNYDIAIPRAYEVQSLTQAVYNMGDSDYIDFSQSYYSQLAYESFTVAGVTLFAAGDSDFADDQLADVLYFNKDMLAKQSDNDIYELVDEGGWTFDILTSLARAVSGDLNGNSKEDDEDKYGFGTKNFAKFFQFFGITEVSVVDGLYQVTLDKGNPNAVVSAILECTSGSKWCRTSWGGDWGGAMGVAFAEGRLLFYNDVFQSAQNFSSITFEMGILPFPKLNDEQENYCAPVLAQHQTTVICIPKATQDRAMSEYFIDVLSWTGRDYIIPNFQKTIESKLSSDYEEDMRIYEEHIKANMTYDVGALTNGHNQLLGGVRSGSYAENKDNFSKLFGENSGTAATTVETWNMNWGAYSD